MVSFSHSKNTFHQEDGYLIRTKLDEHAKITGEKILKQSNESVNLLQEKAKYKPRVINTTDLGADPDDKQSLVRQLVSANEFDIEGLIVSTGCWRKTQSNTDMLDQIVNAYAEVYDNLTVHAEGFPSPEYLKSISIMGQLGYGMSDVGLGKDSPGSELIINALLPFGNNTSFYH